MVISCNSKRCNEFLETKFKSIFNSINQQEPGLIQENSSFVNVKRESTQYRRYSWNSRDLRDLRDVRDPRQSRDPSPRFQNEKPHSYSHHSSSDSEGSYSSYSSHSRSRSRQRHSRDSRSFTNSSRPDSRQEQYLNERKEKKFVWKPRILCRYFANGYCKSGDRCTFAHGTEELDAGVKSSSSVFPSSSLYTRGELRSDSRADMRIESRVDGRTAIPTTDSKTESIKERGVEIHKRIVLRESGQDMKESLLNSIVLGIQSELAELLLRDLKSRFMNSIILQFIQTPIPDLSISSCETVENTVQEEYKVEQQLEEEEEVVNLQRSESFMDLIQNKKPLPSFKKRIPLSHSPLTHSKHSKGSHQRTQVEEQEEEEKEIKIYNKKSTLKMEMSDSDSSLVQDVDMEDAEDVEEQVDNMIMEEEEEDNSSQQVYKSIKNKKENKEKSIKKKEKKIKKSVGRSSRDVYSRPIRTSVVFDEDFDEEFIHEDAKEFENDEKQDSMNLDKDIKDTKTESNTESDSSDASLDLDSLPDNFFDSQDAEEQAFLRQVLEIEVLRRKESRDCKSFSGPYTPDGRKRHASGSARTEGYYKLSAAEKKLFLQWSRQSQSTLNDNKLSQTPGNETFFRKITDDLRKVTSRANRIAHRQYSSGFTTADSSESLRFSQLKARKKRLKFARSSIHDWGLFAMEKIEANEMIIEYIGELIRLKVTFYIK